MKNQSPSHGEPWKTIKGKARSVTIFREESGGRLFYRILIPWQEPLHYSISNEETIMAIASLLANEPIEKTLSFIGEDFPTIILADGQNLRQTRKGNPCQSGIGRNKARISDVANHFLELIKNDPKIHDAYYHAVRASLERLVESVGAQTVIGAVTKDQLIPIVFRGDRSERFNESTRRHVRIFFDWCSNNQYLDHAKPTAADLLPEVKDSSADSGQNEATGESQL